MYEIERIIRTALQEDIGAGDLTTEATIAPDKQGEARLVAKESFVLAGLEVGQQVFAAVNPHINFTTRRMDGERLDAGDELARVAGPAAGLLQAERVALNLLQRMSGIATLTAQFVTAVAGTRAQIVDTRKTTPGLRILEKYAVRVGGGRNHRYALYDGVLIKENHIAAAGGIHAAVKRARRRLSHIHKIEIETRNLDEVQEALDAGADIILLDNMDNDSLRAAVEQVAGRALTEASGGVDLERVQGIAQTGVDLISVGALTHSYRAVDISMLFDTDA